MNEFFSFLSPTTYFRAGRHENKEKRLFTFGFINRLPIQIQLSDIENPKIQNSTPPTPHPCIEQFFLLLVHFLKRLPNSVDLFSGRS
jgi:hypothetical protein